MSNDIPKIAPLWFQCRWLEISRRCNDQHNESYERYGAVGITCEFDTCQQMWEHMSALPSYSHGFVVGRIDESKSYQIGNVKCVPRAMRPIASKAVEPVEVVEMTAPKTVEVIAPKTVEVIAPKTVEVITVSVVKPKATKKPTRKFKSEKTAIRDRLLSETSLTKSHIYRLLDSGDTEQEILKREEIVSRIATATSLPRKSILSQLSIGRTEEEIIERGLISKRVSQVTDLTFSDVNRLFNRGITEQQMILCHRKSIEA